MVLAHPKIIHDRIILGIDPGTNVMGYGLIKIKENKLSMIAMGVLKLTKYEDQYLKVKKIFDRIISLIDEFHPDEFAIESQFYGKNVQSMLKLGRAQGTCIAAALQRDMPIFEYAPLKIKMALTGNGRASKEQVSFMLQKMFRLKKDTMIPELDATDALAIAVCHYLQSSRPQQEKSYTSWKDYANRNNKKIV